MWGTRAVGYYSAIQRDEELTHSSARMNQNTILRERRKLQKGTYYTIPFIQNVQNWQIHRVSTDGGCQGSWGRWTGSDNSWVQVSFR